VEAALAEDTVEENSRVVAFEALGDYWVLLEAL
jgi:hypothetical protein